MYILLYRYFMNMHICMYCILRMYSHYVYTWVYSCSHTVYIRISLSTIVLNSRDWSEILWLSEILCFKINLAISFYLKKPAGMHWLGYNDAVSSLNEAKTRIFQPTTNFENFEICLYFVCQPANQPAVRPGCVRCGLQKFHMIKVMAADL